jgi:DNA-binding NarL/FixJ family response regulator
MKPVRILLADDYPLVRQAIRRMLDHRPDWEVVAEAEDGAEAVRLAVEHQPDLAVIDVAMRTLNGIEAARQIARAVPATRIVMLTINDDEPYVVDALDAGANGYVLKEAADVELVRAIDEVASGGRYLSPALSFTEPVKYRHAE